VKYVTTSFGPLPLSNGDHPDAEVYARSGAFEDGDPLVGHETPIPYGRVHADQKIIPIEVPWQNRRRVGRALTGVNAGSVRYERFA
jgi:hypothetical protein